jgi:hypothetical protein
MLSLYHLRLTDSLRASHESLPVGCSVSSATRLAELAACIRAKRIEEVTGYSKPL